MADVDPFDFQGAPQGAPPPQQGGLVEQWGAALQNPATRAGLMQMGLQMMQPMGFGQSPLGHLAQSVGAGGEAATRVEDADLKDQLAQQRIDASNETISQGRQRLAIGNRNASTRERAAASRTGSGGLSAKDLFRQQNSMIRNMETDADREARGLATAVENARIMGPIPAHLKPYEGKLPGDIKRELLADPQWTKRYKESRDAAVNTAIPPPAQRVPNQVYVTPKGPMVWKGNGWAPATATAPALPDEAEEE